jgi:hypothetical protein
MGGAATPIPQLGLGGAYLGDVFSRYLQPNFPSLAFTEPCTVTTCGDVTGLATPEGDYPLLSGVKSLPLDTSVSQGQTILNQAITGQLAANPSEPVGVFGFNQSAIISSLEMTQLHSEGVPSDNVNFVLIGDLMNPNGGVFERFAGLQLPSIGYNFYGATPGDLYPTAIYTLEYDGLADFPQYPINLLSDLNAFAGTQFVSLTYPTLTADQLDAAIHLTNTVGPTMTNYFMIPVDQLPLLDPVRDIPLIGNPLADLLQPDLTLLVNLGYDNPDPLEGWSAGPPNVGTPFGLFPPLSQVIDALKLLLPQTELGIQNFIGDFTGTGPDPVSLSLSALMPSLLGGSSGLAGMLSDPGAALAALAADPGSLITGLANTASSIASTAYATLLPTADFANALLTSIPAYDVSLFLDNLSDPINAVGLPIAADTAMLPLLGGFEFFVLGNALTSIVGDLSGLIP